MQCIDLIERYGERFRTYKEVSRSLDPWTFRIMCHYGHICPWSEETLSACTKIHGRISNILERLPFSLRVQSGSDGSNVEFHIDHFDEVAAIMKPRIRRHLSIERKSALFEASRGTWFGAQSGYGVPGRVSTPFGDI